MTANISHDRIARVRASLKSLEAKSVADHARIISEAEQLIYDLTPPPAPKVIAPVTAGQGVEAVIDAIDDYLETIPCSKHGPLAWPTVEGIKAAIRSALAHQPLSVQEVWQLVPVEPTDAMIEAWQQSIDNNSGFNLRVWTPEANAPFECWKAMLAAAPTVGGEQE